ncbi:CPBP family intramembrane metalloprotease [Caulobacter vibrioides]|uniref:Abortive infection protein n=1 Tax=Caulobacter vibrioides (strain NA1000 / CB15N) TaxID=565050 RepID=A0A0H3C4F9_CAUVN|nr:type II CAAX endopeptidase family protein [Caulobacter vibrioides]YP_002516091.1 CAAX abortive infection protease [Caulobacter vibrioides NA1000]ACL94183.1 CAAX abortive infection protease [Caulobacter vibrioides NA1000]ATC27521.1 CPBP family intramembrane metalloprotease [Caulobacter vibrioides]AZH11895.1 CPBP family intramembrane metalloprotease [Caulobacter vibrioides]QXZ52761.1 CPBP family intramembrane metalloprotease [Caulobacter vibrioides]
MIGIDNSVPTPSLARQAISILAGALGGFASGLIAVSILLGVLGIFDLRPLTDSERLSVFENGALYTAELAIILLALAVGFVGTAGAVLKRPFVEWLTDGRGLRFDLCLYGLTLGAAATLAGLIGNAAIDGDRLGFIGSTPSGLAPGIWVYLVAMPLGFLVAAFAEELFFRGYLLKLLRWWGAHPVVAITVTSIAFAAFHLEFQPEVFALRMLSGAALAWSVYRLGGIEFAVGAHAAGNIVLAFFIPPLSETTTSSADLYGVGIEILTSAMIIIGVEVVRARLSFRADTFSLWAKEGGT